MKKIDVHTHVTYFPDFFPVRKSDKQRILSADEQIKVLDDVNTEKCVLLPIVAPECQWGTISNEETKMLADTYPDRFVWFCNVDPRAGEYSENTDLEHLVGYYKSLGAKGLGELTTPLYADDPMMDNLFTVCERLKMPITIHIAPKHGGYYGIVDEMGLPRIEKMLKKHPDLIILGHSQAFWCEMSGDLTEEQRSGYPKGKVKEGRLHQLLREYGNLHCDLSAGSAMNALTRDPENAARFIEEFADRMYYGTDICSPKQNFHIGFSDYLQKLVDDKMISLENYEKIIRKNAEKLLGI